MTCPHKSFLTDVTINFLEDTRRFTADIRIKCNDCGVPMRFIGLPAGVDLNGAAVSADGTEARLAIAPKGEVVSAIEGGAAGFTVRKNNPLCSNCHKPIQTDCQCGPWVDGGAMTND